MLFDGIVKRNTRQATADVQLYEGMAVKYVAHYRDTKHGPGLTVEYDAELLDDYYQEIEGVYKAIVYVYNF